jgi:hypothetical protein
MNNQNGAMKRGGGLKGSFPSGSGGSLRTGLSSRRTCSSSTAETDRQGANQMPADAATVAWKGK